MADNSVFITGIADDAFADEIRKLPPWATEQTLGKIAGYMQKSLGLQAAQLAALKKCCAGGGAGGGDKDRVETAKKLNDELGKLSRNLGTRNKEDAAAAKAAARADAKNKVYEHTLGLLSAAGLKLTDVYKRSFIVSDSLLESGINTTAGMDNLTEAGLSLQQAVRLTSVRFETLLKVAETYASSINAIGFNKFAKTVNATSAQLKEFGYSNQQQAELVGYLIESESAYSDIRSKSSTQVANDAILLGKRLNLLSLTMGVSIQKMNENALSFSKSTDATVMSAIWGEKAASNMKTFIGSFGDNKGAADIMQKLAATQNPILTKAYQDMAKAGQAGLADSMTSIARYARDTGDTIGAQNQLQALALRTGSETFKALEIQASAGNEGAAATLQALTAFRQTATTMSKATTEEIAQATTDKAVRAKAKAALEEAAAAPDKTFAALNSQITALTAGVNIFNSIVDKLNSLINPVTMSYAGVLGIAIGAVAGFTLAVRAGTSVISPFIDLFSRSGKALTTTAGTTNSALGSFGSKLGQVAKGLAMIAAPAVIDSVAGSMGVGGKTIDEQQDKENWAKASFLEKAQSGLARTIEAAGGLIGASNFANEARAERIASETEYLNKKHGVQPKKSPEISVPKEPAGSTVDSPSATTPTATATSATSAGSPATQSAPALPGIEAPGADAEINTLLRFQAKIMQQTLETTTALLRTNNDILRYTRSRA